MSAINGKIIERIVNIPANTAFESFSKFLKLKKYSIGESNTTTGHLVFKTSLGGLRYILYNGNYIFSCDICNLQIFLCLFLEKLNMPQNTPVTKVS